MLDLPPITSNYLKVVVKPGAKITEVKGWDGTEHGLRISLASRAVGGKANLELVKFLSKELSKKVTIVTGKTARVKLLKLTNKR